MRVWAERTLRVPPEEAFAAWTEPGRLREWWGPPGFSVDRIDGDLAVGSSYRILMRPPEGDVFELVWTFDEISPPERLVYRWRWAPGGDETHVTVAFRATPEGTRVELLHTGFAEEDDRQHHEDGWDDCLQRLNQMV